MSIPISHAPTTTLSKPADPVFYPETDGQPMGESEWHVIATLYLLSALRNFFAARSDIYVIADMFMYYEEGNPSANKAPDVMVVKNIEQRKRRIFKVWEEGAVPCTIIEVTSKSTWAEDTIRKSSLYARLGVTEYFLFDPLHEYMDDQFMGFRLEDGEYIPIESSADGSIFSQELGVILRPDGDLLRVINPATNRIVPGMEDTYTYAEESQALVEQVTQRAEQAAQRAEKEAQRAQAAEAELERLRAEVDQLRAQQRRQD
ncbi:MAG: Uma2 family endonuclease [Caldilineaceae bacterium]|nr:Uma2 family endonuclease [Caldilineaceae bacterium]